MIGSIWSGIWYGIERYDQVVIRNPMIDDSGLLESDLVRFFGNKVNGKAKKRFVASVSLPNRGFVARTNENENTRSTSGSTIPLIVIAIH